MLVGIRNLKFFRDWLGFDLVKVQSLIYLYKFGIVDAYSLLACDYCLFCGGEKNLIGYECKFRDTNCIVKPN